MSTYTSILARSLDCCYLRKTSGRMFSATNRKCLICNDLKNKIFLTHKKCQKQGVLPASHQVLHPLQPLHPLEALGLALLVCWCHPQDVGKVTRVHRSHTKQLA